ncbi:hypothetical protein ANAPH1_00649 [Anaplasma phagocytophilum]|uniref:p44-49 outer membrane, silent domain protein n=1 Tax=Anaplasma phagocytophilum str. ApMUC09 TaxID=1359152 RepID=A0A0F3N8E2_ANAPH|nr:P44-49 outer membrane, silent domain protein [Anaplasma phagocytophilum str. ApMUC09]SCV63193.1 hypothetical protein ANAPH2_00557 [Anaplasma phagocytophilum]SCV64662.1 hypothetical protein ANAPH1_00649 [Anaplasma phagocytophilum]
MIICLEVFVAASLLAKTIEGGEVVDIRAVSSTSVMINFCDGPRTLGMLVILRYWEVIPQEYNFNTPL